jgi:signal transduction histidine kinase
VAIEVRDGFAEIRVSDNGPGVPADRRDDIFKPFVSTKGSRGTGLGLPSARKTLREHGGDLFVQPDTENGATFVFRLPLG